MAGQFHDLLVDASTQARRAADLAEEVARRVDSVGDDVGDLRERVAKLEALQDATKEWHVDERREVKERLGSGDATFQRIILENRDLKAAVEQSSRDVFSAKTKLAALEREIARLKGRGASRLWYVGKLILQAAIPVLITLLLLGGKGGA